MYRALQAPRRNRDATEPPSQARSGPVHSRGPHALFFWRRFIALRVGLGSVGSLRLAQRADGDRPLLSSHTFSFLYLHVPSNLRHWPGYLDVSGRDRLLRNPAGIDPCDRAGLTRQNIGNVGLDTGRELGNLLAERSQHRFGRVRWHTAECCPVGMTSSGESTSGESTSIAASSSEAAAAGRAYAARVAWALGSRTSLTGGQGTLGRGCEMVLL